jgi:hypothetical protein
MVLALVVMQAADGVSMPPALALYQQIDDPQPMRLILPHALQKGETAWLLVRVGVIGHHQIQLATKDGRPMGTISPFDVRSGRGAGTYTIPVPPEALDKQWLAFRLSVVESDGTERVPKAGEIKSIRLVIRRFKTRN